MSSFNSPLKTKVRLHCYQSSTCSCDKRKEKKRKLFKSLLPVRWETFVPDITIGKCQMMFAELKALRIKNWIDVL